MDRLTGKVAIVTGGGAGIGAATCAAFVAEGARVVVADIDLAAASAVAETLGDAATAHRFDALDTASIGALVDGTAERFGRLDVLHNNAGGTAEGDLDVVDIPFEVWDRILAWNATATLAGSKFAVPHMIAGGGGSIINTASVAGLRGSITRTAYGAAKAAVISLTRYVATQYSKQGVRANAIAPGPILTAPLLSVISDEDRAAMAAHALVPGLGVPEDIAALAVFLASDESRNITGQVISSDGGMTAPTPMIADMRANAARARS